MKTTLLLTAALFAGTLTVASPAFSQGNKDYPEGSIFWQYFWREYPELTPKDMRPSPDWSHLVPVDKNSATENKPGPTGPEPPAQHQHSDASPAILPVARARLQFTR